ncbi:cellulase family glycosylhydrolase [Calothrix sp. 336/3]|uniref:cellulase family glycosylhydrolase n=1 Tax=Calothrix sp. 336/3 TaxID=1337936 RepID=UPI0004E41CE5|nr:cellulase family glycosylhydrolase [Calothrix sp. 336/3]AKG22350.1 glycoside hydrolase [Calothrix sp. 336/3]
MYSLLNVIIKKRGFYKILFIFSIITVIFLDGIFGLAYSQVTPAKTPLPITLPLSTRKAKIIDAQGKTILLRGVNWFGMETASHVPHGLWARDYKEMLAQIKSLGYNFIRLPYSVAGLRSSNISSVDFRIGSNKELEGKTPLEVMDAVIQAAAEQGLLILLDSHRLNDERIPELWYGDGFTETDWIDTWKMLAERYKNQANVIGADLKNEPHGKASWGTGNRLTDWRLAAEKAGNAILAINPHWLIVVEGVEKNVPQQKQQNYWHGGNLEGVKRFPVRLSRRHKLVYSPHEYGAGVYPMPYFSDKQFPKNLTQRWQIGFNYIASQNIAPILVGEFGGRQIDNNSPEGIWQNKFIKFIRQQHLSFAYWSWNPNSQDTGGILLENWQAIDEPKQQLISQLLPVKFTASPAPSPSPIPREASKPENNLSPRLPTPTSNSLKSLQVATNIYSDWQTGFCVNFQVKNASNKSIKKWQILFKMKQAAINNSWNGNFLQQKTNQYLVTPQSWAEVIDSQQQREMGFCANKLGSDYKPTQVEITGS